MYELNIELKYAGLFEKVHLEQATSLLHPFNQNQKAQNARWDLVGEKVGKVETPPQNFNLLRKYLVGKCFEKGGVSPLFLSI